MPVEVSDFLTQKELWVAILVTEGLRNREIARALGTTEHMVKNYMRSIYEKTGHSSRVELALWWIKNMEGR